MTERTAPLPPADDELWLLVEAIVGDTASPAERDRLEARLGSDPHARLFYVAYLDIHAQLQWRTRGQTAPPVAAPAPAPPPARAARPRRPSRRLLAVALPAAALATAAAVVVGVLALRHGPEEGESLDLPDTPAGSVAVLIDTGHPVWDRGTTLPTRTGSALPPGRLKLTAGVAEIAFRGGGEVLLEGPAEFDVSAADAGFLHRGRLTAKVADGTPALRVGMPGVTVTDVGGECGLWRDETGLTEVHVFEGRVGADPADRPGEPPAPVRWIEHAAARIDAAGRTFTAVPLNAQAFAHLRPEVRVIDASVRDGEYSDHNFGTASRLMVKNSIPDYSWETYLRFDLSGVRGRVGRATVRLVPVLVGQPFENAAAAVADDHWGETAITWDTAPASGPAFATWVVEEGKPVEFDVTRLVGDALAGDRMLSLRIFAPKRKRGRAYVQYGSREGDAEARPQLILTPAHDPELTRLVSPRDRWPWLALWKDG
jgi:hypothetical protein